LTKSIPLLAGRLRQALDKYQIGSDFARRWRTGTGSVDFYEGPLTIGLVPRETRTARIAHIKKASDFAKQCASLRFKRTVDSFPRIE